ncbi:HESP111 [Hemileuca sp. nucleopolyhedrovirus]|uniref:HESP111 n=1 Tax=Hemileuca sp. nucleopolyhedrovirus TaxID=1367203 RepID=S5MQB8_9ABAC|nr:HESP111 [Hemileuca sp. nucleopolyhedrovirus]AGR56863.1 HESP111 [Hemileuca sp. nucleopolyhedrovirus]
MQIGSYIIVITTNSDYRHNESLVETILNYCFCPLFYFHTFVCSYSVCEDKMFIENGSVTFQYYGDFLRSPYSESSNVTIREFGSSEHSFHMIHKLVDILNNNYDNHQDNINFIDV